MELPGREPISGVYFVFVSNSSPWTYANDRPMCTNPGTSFETGLGVFGVTRLKVVPSLRLLRQMFSKQPKIEGDQVIRDDDAACVRVTCADPPMASQFDGDYLGVRERMTFRAVPDACRRRPAHQKAFLTCELTIKDRGQKHWSVAGECSTTD